MTIFSLCILLASLYTAGIVLTGRRKMHRLEDAATSPRRDFPPVSIIVPACNEEKTLEPALLSLLEQDYPHLEIIAVDDRSTDNTLALLQKIKDRYPALRIEQIRHLPAGWMGKNHALHRGAQTAQGDILLFTDADVVMKPGTVSRAAAWMTEQQLDHLSLVFRNIAPGGLLNAMIVDALGGLFLLLRPWNVRRSGSRSFIGVGAFNMIRSAAYRQIGGHAALRMHPIDDVMLGKKVKQMGLRQDCLLGGSFVQVRWYATVAEMVQGLMKNIFALYGYRISSAAAGITGIIVMTVVPAWGVLLAPGWPRLFFGGAVICRFIVFSRNAALIQAEKKTVLWSLLTPYCIIYIIVLAVWTTLHSQGITWRGTHYSLQELKQQEPLFTLFS